MSYLEAIKQWLGLPGSTTSPLVDVISVAKDDPQIRETLVTILQLPLAQRRSALLGLSESIRLQQGPEALITAIQLLKDTRLADQTLAILLPD